MRSLSGSILLLGLCLLLSITLSTALAQPQQAPELSKWYSMIEFNAEIGICKHLLDMQLDYQELQQFFQLWQNFRVQTAVTDAQNAALLAKVREKVLSAKTEDELNKALKEANPGLKRLQEAYKQQVDQTVKAVERLLGPKRWARLKLQDTLFNWPAEVIRLSRKLYKENPEFFAKEFRENIISEIAKQSKAGLAPFPDQEMREWLDKVASMPQDELDQHSMELYLQFVKWILPPSQVEAALDDLKKHNHARQFVQELLENPFIGYVLMGRLQALMQAQQKGK